MTCNDARLLVAIRRPGGNDFLPEDAAELDRYLAVRQQAHLNP